MVLDERIGESSLQIDCVVFGLDSQDRVCDADVDAGCWERRGITEEEKILKKRASLLGVVFLSAELNSTPSTLCAPRGC